MKAPKTLKEITEEWLQDKKSTIKVSTYYRYIYIINQYIMPHFKNIEMQELEKYDFNIFIEELNKKLKPGTVRGITRFMKNILNYSKVKYGYKFNLDIYNTPKEKESPIHLLTKKEKDKLERYCLKNNSLKHIGIIICLNTGLKIGEICALKWENINLEENTLNVNYTIQRIYNKLEKGGEIIKDKTNYDYAIRKIPLSKRLCNILKPLKELYPDNSFVLTGLEEKFIEPRTYQKMFKKCLDDCEIEDFHFQNLRYQFIYDCINDGMDYKTLIEILGQSDIPKYLKSFYHSSYDIKLQFLEKL